MSESLAIFVLSFFIYSCAGWLFEVIIAAFQHHRFVNRGFLFGPLCPIYGAGGLVAVVVLSPLGNPALEFICGFVLAFVLEYGTSWLLEKAFHARWWDYSDYRFNLNGRVCLYGLTLFATLMVLVCLVFQPIITALFLALPARLCEGLAFACLLLLAFDVAASVAHMDGFNRKLEAAQESLASVGSALTTSIGSAFTVARENAADWALDHGLPIPRPPAELSAAMRDVRRAIASAGSSEYVEMLRARLPRFSFLDRHELNDPHFMPTRAREAWELVKALVSFGPSGGSDDPAVVFRTSNDVSTPSTHTDVQ